MNRMYRSVALSLVIVACGAFAFDQDPPAPVVQQPVVFGCPMHPEVQSKVAGKCPKCNMTLVELTGGGGDEGFFTCPMHPEIQTGQPGTCPKCKMKLVKAAPPETGDYTVRMDTEPRAVKAGEKVTLRFTVFHPVSDEQIKNFAIMHDMPFHLFVVSQDFEHFDHIHPDQEKDGSFSIETVLPQPGYYKIFCDFFPVGGSPQVAHLNLVTAGYKGDLAGSIAKLVPDQTLVKTVEGTRFELTLDPEKPFAGKPAELKYKLFDAKSNKPVSDLKPYLGAWGHTLILSADASDYLHSHPTEMIPDDVDRNGLEGKPEVDFETFFPHPGPYRIWSQFMRGDKLITVSFTVFIPRLH
jgi:hypothetical protein